MKKIFEIPEIEVLMFKAKSVILTESDPNDDLGNWSPDII